MRPLDIDCRQRKPAARGGPLVRHHDKCKQQRDKQRRQEMPLRKERDHAGLPVAPRLVLPTRLGRGRPMVVRMRARRSICFMPTERLVPVGADRQHAQEKHQRHAKGRRQAAPSRRRWDREQHRGGQSGRIPNASRGLLFPPSSSRRTLADSLDAAPTPRRCAAGVAGTRHFTQPACFRSAAVAGIKGLAVSPVQRCSVRSPVWLPLGPEPTAR